MHATLSPPSCSFNCADCRCSVPYRAGIMDLQVQISESNILFSITSSACTLVLFFMPNAPRPRESFFFNVALSCTMVWGSLLCVHWLYLSTASQRLKKKKKSALMREAAIAADTEQRLHNPPVKSVTLSHIAMDQFTRSIVFCGLLLTEPPLLWI